MGWRTVVVEKPSKLELRMGYLVVRNAESTVRVHLGEISVLIIENTASSVTSALISGFLMMQESVYVKLSLNSTQTEQLISDVKKIQPSKGLVQILTVTEKQFSKMEMLCGKCSTDVINSDERLLII